MTTATQTRWAEHALAKLQAAGYRRSGARTAVVEALARHDCAVTALDLDDELRRRKPRSGARASTAPSSGSACSVGSKSQGESPATSGSSPTANTTNTRSVATAAG
jgi:hypothetical protein